MNKHGDRKIQNLTIYNKRSKGTQRGFSPRQSERELICVWLGGIYGDAL